ncbi:Gas vesicle protein [Caminicella sporogenes DSM 14501]|uniref:Gas vesicle protein n=1 Tax=Caminicella sporogenes DSM 14501 TaxID=1121266 RepID=A0A1M6SEG4_9FIRM|nr:YtxH domain-containing protein [Caminicella sporogenes]RKD26632.1 hypothetical protein BET04_10110 [Caminicella sporogenes]WIF95938.1 YtxH domain-containing protein [Caminicella sporogenes]SHK43100.1 Gas vesicle protein [Caminicella sporogenes DSM 14501]
MFLSQRKREIEAKMNFNRGFTTGAVIGTLLGGIIGGALGILIAPDSGKNTRKKIYSSADELKNNIEKELLEVKNKINEDIRQSILQLKNEIAEKNFFRKEKEEIQTNLGKITYSKDLVSDGLIEVDNIKENEAKEKNEENI